MPRQKQFDKGGPWIAGDVKDGFCVGFKGEEREDPYDRYHGPTARISYDKSWLHIVTDDYEGHAMLNIETLQMLRRALAQIARDIRRK